MFNIDMGKESQDLENYSHYHKVVASSETTRVDINWGRISHLITTVNWTSNKIVFLFYSLSIVIRRK